VIDLRQVYLVQAFQVTNFWFSEDVSESWKLRVRKQQPHSRKSDVPLAEE
jgi:hypothetical protein